MEYSRVRNGKFLEIYALTILQLNLCPVTQSFRPRLTSRQVSFGFTMDAAIKVLVSLLLRMELTHFATKMSYEISHDLARQFVQKFFDAHLVHCPGQRCSTLPPLASVPIQPTAKGVAVVSLFVVNMGMLMLRWPSIVHSEYNSMKLVVLPRDPVKDTLKVSPALVLLLFTWMMGPFRNVWDPLHKSDPISMPSSPEIPHLPARMDSLVDAKPLVLPYYHRYYTNPALEAVTQYYTSTVGIRLIKELNCGSFSEYNCFSGKGMCQWILDCTDVVSLRQAAEFGNKMLAMQLIEPITKAPLKLTHALFAAKRNCYYSIGPMGKMVIHATSTPNPSITTDRPPRYSIDEWIQSYLGGDAINTHKPRPTTADLLLRQTLSDPGYTLLFQQYLDKELSGENLQAYIKLDGFQEMIDHLVSVIETADSYHIRLAINDCKSHAFHIFVIHISEDGASSVNIDSLLRLRVLQLFIDPEREIDENRVYLNTPVSAEFPEDPFCPPVEDVFGIEHPLPDLTHLARLLGVYRQIKNHLYRTMETDSFERFRLAQWALV